MLISKRRANFGGCHALPGSLCLESNDRRSIEESNTLIGAYFRHGLRIFVGIAALIVAGVSRAYNIVDVILKSWLDCEHFASANELAVASGSTHPFSDTNCEIA